MISADSITYVSLIDDGMESDVAIKIIGEMIRNTAEDAG